MSNQQANHHRSARSEAIEEVLDRVFGHEIAAVEARIVAERKAARDKIAAEAADPARPIRETAPPYHPTVARPYDPSLQHSEPPIGAEPGKPVTVNPGSDNTFQLPG